MYKTTLTKKQYQKVKDKIYFTLMGKKTLKFSELSKNRQYHIICREEAKHSVKWTYKHLIIMKNWDVIDKKNDKILENIKDKFKNWENVEYYLYYKYIFEYPY